MSLIRLRRQPNITEDMIKNAQDAVDRWVAIRKMMSSDGWHYLSEDIKKELDRQDTVRGLADQNLSERRGKVEGLDYPFARLRDYERASIEGEKLLAFVAATTKEQ